MADHTNIGYACDYTGARLRCDWPGCTQFAAHRRYLPRRLWKTTGQGTYLMGLDEPDFPINGGSIELRCPQHITDWQHGPISLEEARGRCGGETRLRPPARPEIPGKRGGGHA